MTEASTSDTSAQTATDEPDAVDQADGETPAEKPSQPDTDLLIREGDIAADYLEGLLDILDYDGDIDMDVQNDRAMVAVSGSLQDLVGQRGVTLEALQELTRLAVYRGTRVPSRLMLDVGGYRDARRKELAATARNAAEQVREHGELVRMAPMSAFERKCVHDVINATDGVVSESEGEEPDRYVVVHPDTD
ncbi:MAG: single-stranded DNA-binding protein [Micromonosporaceae bacterium]|nr:single-stranded DNA-binding protein [Micromonosporaceae bacterium]